MTQQPEALQLADALEEKEYPPRRAAADELRRLHSVNAQLLEALENLGNVASNQVSIESDMSPIEKAIQDAMMCGTGVMKFSFMDGLVSCDHVPIKEFAQLSDELKWRSENTHEDAK